VRLRWIPILAVLTAAFVWAERAARTARGDAYEERVKPGHCPCAEGQACWHYLRSPLKPPADKCRCGCCLSGGTCESRDRPKGTSAACWASPKEECFWKRHAWSWKLQCSQCLTDTECDACDKDLVRDPKVVERIQKQLVFEGSTKRNPLWIVVSPHFYVVTNLHHEVKVPTEGGAPRLASGHEIAHLYAQRLEIAWEDFNHWFGGGVSMGRPMAVYLVRSKQQEEAIQERYFGGAKTDMNYGYGDGDRIAGGMSGNGFAACYSEEGSDLSMHALCRHMVGHINFSCWVTVSGKERECPIWAFEGAAYFMEKLLPEHFDIAHYCTSETAAPSGSPKDWDKKARGIAARGPDPIETWFARESLGRFSWEDRVRSWSVFDLALREDRDRFLKSLSHIRHSEDEGPAFKQGFGFTPDTFQQRWVERLTGRRPTLGEMKNEEDPEIAGSRERARIRETQEADLLAGLIRGLHKIEDVKTLEAVVGRLDHPSDLVRESILLVLRASNSLPIRDWLRTLGLQHKDALGRAGVARVLGEQKDVAARGALEALLGDAHWLVRANAAQALSRIGNKESLPLLVKALAEKQEKAWIATADAVATFAERSKEASLLTAPMLSHVDWQVRLTACRGLVKYGTEEALDALIERYETEGGRMQKELKAALVAVAHDDLGANAESWRKWWAEQKARHGGHLPPEPPKSTNPEDDRYAKPKPVTKDEPRYYGRRMYSRAVGFVLDTSGSMKTNISVPPEATKKLGDIPSTGTRATLAQAALVEALKSMDPRTRFTLVFFSSDVRPWKDGLVPAAGNVESAIGAVESAVFDGETNIYGALKAALGLHEKPSIDATLDPIPDTVYFLTDGAPTRGDITSTPELLSWFEDLNRFAKVELHVVAMGNLGVDLTFLESLAASGGGEFIHIPEK
jgi:hypothetical protein